MPRPSEEILEFDRLRELLRRRTTSAPGGRAMEALGFRTDRASWSGFAAIAEAVVFRLRGGASWASARWPIRRRGWAAAWNCAGRGAVLAPDVRLLDAATLADTAAWLKRL